LVDAILDFPHLLRVGLTISPSFHVYSLLVWLEAIQERAKPLGDSWRGSAPKIFLLIDLTRNADPAYQRRDN
jgi:hypothetical protein